MLAQPPLFLLVHLFFKSFTLQFFNFHELVIQEFLVNQFFKTHHIHVINKINTGTD